MDMDVALCSKRNIHKRTESEISKIISEWEKTPASQTLLDVRSLLQSAAIVDVSFFYSIHALKMTVYAPFLVVK